MFSNPFLAKELAFRGGTALNKIFFPKPMRYSEDIDLVRITTGAIKPIIDAIHDCLNPWLGQPKTKRNDGRFILLYYFTSEIPPSRLMRVKIEINTREYSSYLGIKQREFSIENPWFSGQTFVTTYSLEEILGTKLRALFQRKKGRDLFDLVIALKLFPELNSAKTHECLYHYLAQENNHISRAEFEANLTRKVNDIAFLNDIKALLGNEMLEFDPLIEFQKVKAVFVDKLPGKSWKGLKETITQ